MSIRETPITKAKRIGIGKLNNPATAEVIRPQRMFWGLITMIDLQFPAKFNIYLLKYVMKLIEV